jgi:hypothetical protein
LNCFRLGITGMRIWLPPGPRQTQEGRKSSIHCS